MLYSRFCIKKMGIPLTLIILQQLDTILNELYIDTKVQQGNSNALDVNLPLSIKKYYDRMHEMEVDPTIINKLINNTTKALSDTELNDKAILYKRLN